MSKELEGEFRITGWDESPYLEGPDDTKLSRASVTQKYSGDIEGAGEIEYLMFYKSDHWAVFVGLEMINGSIDGKAGSFVIKHNGTFEEGVARSEFEIVEGSGQDDLAEISGSGTFESDEHGKATYRISLNDR